MVIPKKEAAEIAVETVKVFLQHTNAISKAIFVCFDEENHQLYEQKLHL